MRPLRSQKNWYSFVGKLQGSSIPCVCNEVFLLQDTAEEQFSFLLVPCCRTVREKQHKCCTNNWMSFTLWLVYTDLLYTQAWNLTQSGRLTVKVYHRNNSSLESKGLEVCTQNDSRFTGRKTTTTLKVQRAEGRKIYWFKNSVFWFFFASMK